MYRATLGLFAALAAVLLVGSFSDVAGRDVPLVFFTSPSADRMHRRRRAFSAACATTGIPVTSESHLLSFFVAAESIKNTIQKDLAQKLCSIMEQYGLPVNGPLVNAALGQLASQACGQFESCEKANGWNENVEAVKLGMNSFNYCMKTGKTYEQCVAWGILCQLMDKLKGNVNPFESVLQIFPPVSKICTGGNVFKCCRTKGGCHSAFNSPTPINCEGNVAYGPTYTAGECRGGGLFEGCTCDYLPLCHGPFIDSKVCQVPSGGEARRFQSLGASFNASSSSTQHHPSYPSHWAHDAAEKSRPFSERRPSPNEHRHAFMPEEEDSTPAATPSSNRWAQPYTTVLYDCDSATGYCTWSANLSWQPRGGSRLLDGRPNQVGVYQLEGRRQAFLQLLGKTVFQEIQTQTNHAAQSASPMATSMITPLSDYGLMRGCRNWTSMMTRYSPSYDTGYEWAGEGEWLNEGAAQGAVVANNGSAGVPPGGTHGVNTTAANSSTLNWLRSPPPKPIADRGSYSSRMTKYYNKLEMILVFAILRVTNAWPDFWDRFDFTSRFEWSSADMAQYLCEVGGIDVGAPRYNVTSVVAVAYNATVNATRNVTTPRFDAAANETVNVVEVVTEVITELHWRNETTVAWYFNYTAVDSVTLAGAAQNEMLKTVSPTTIGLLQGALPRFWVLLASRVPMSWSGPVRVASPPSFSTTAPPVADSSSTTFFDGCVNAMPPLVLSASAIIVPIDALEPTVPGTLEHAIASRCRDRALWDASQTSIYASPTTTTTTMPPKPLNSSAEGNTTTTSAQQPQFPSYPNMATIWVMVELSESVAVLNEAVDAYGAAGLPVDATWPDGRTTRTFLTVSDNSTGDVSLADLSVLVSSGDESTSQRLSATAGLEPRANLCACFAYSYPYSAQYPLMDPLGAARPDVTGPVRRRENTIVVQMSNSAGVRAVIAVKPKQLVPFETVTRTATETSTATATATTTTTGTGTATKTDTFTQTMTSTFENDTRTSTTTTATLPSPPASTAATPASVPPVTSPPRVPAAWFNPVAGRGLITQVTAVGILHLNRWFGDANLYVSLEGFADHTALEHTQLMAKLISLQNRTRTLAMQCSTGASSLDECEATRQLLRQQYAALQQSSPGWSVRSRRAFLGMEFILQRAQPVAWATWDVFLPFEWNFDARMLRTGLTHRPKGATQGDRSNVTTAGGLKSFMLQCASDDGYYYSGANFFLQHIKLTFSNGVTARHVPKQPLDIWTSQVGNDTVASTYNPAFNQQYQGYDMWCPRVVWGTWSYAIDLSDDPKDYYDISMDPLLPPQVGTDASSSVPSTNVQGHLVGATSTAHAFLEVLPLGILDTIVTLPSTTTTSTTSTSTTVTPTSTATPTVTGTATGTLTLTTTTSPTITTTASTSPTATSSATSEASFTTGLPTTPATPTASPTATPTTYEFDIRVTVRRGSDLTKVAAAMQTLLLSQLAKAAVARGMRVSVVVTVVNQSSSTVAALRPFAALQQQASPSASSSSASTSDQSAAVLHAQVTMVADPMLVTSSTTTATSVVVVGSGSPVSTSSSEATTTAALPDIVTLVAGPSLSVSANGSPVAAVRLQTDTSASTATSLWVDALRDVGVTSLALSSAVEVASPDNAAALQTQPSAKNTVAIAAAAGAIGVCMVVAASVFVVRYTLQRRRRDADTRQAFLKRTENGTRLNLIEGDVGEWLDLGPAKPGGSRGVDTDALEMQEVLQLEKA